MPKLAHIVRDFFWPRSRGGKIRMLVELVLLAVIIIAGCGRCDRLFYFPNDQVYGDPKRYGIEVEDVVFPSTDGTRLHGWFIPAKTERPRATVLFCHGNAQNITAHFMAVEYLPEEGYNVFIFDYRGFGRSEGTPTREGTFQDTVAALQYVQTRDDVKPLPLIGYGQSLGGALLLAALGETDPKAVRCIAVESTFLSYQGVGQAHLARMWWTWILQWPFSRWLVTDGHSPSHSLDRLAGVPLLVMHGDDDDIVPYSQGVALFERAAEPKRFYHAEGGTHCAGTGSISPAMSARCRKVLLDFFDECLR